MVAVFLSPPGARRTMKKISGVVRRGDSERRGNTAKRTRRRRERFRRGTCAFQRPPARGAPRAAGGDAVAPPGRRKKLDATECRRADASGARFFRRGERRSAPRGTRRGAASKDGAMPRARRRANARFRAAAREYSGTRAARDPARVFFTRRERRVPKNMFVKSADKFTVLPRGSPVFRADPGRAFRASASIGARKAKKNRRPAPFPSVGGRGRDACFHTRASRAAGQIRFSRRSSGASSDMPEITRHAPAASSVARALLVVTHTHLMPAARAASASIGVSPA